LSASGWISKQLKTFVQCKQAYYTHTHTVKPTSGIGSERVCIIQKSSYNGLSVHVLLDICSPIAYGQVNSVSHSAGSKYFIALTLLVAWQEERPVCKK